MDRNVGLTGCDGVALNIPTSSPLRKFCPCLPKALMEKKCHVNTLIGIEAEERKGLSATLPFSISLHTSASQKLNVKDWES
ncbi:hypothetical protein E2C01_049087 [Portunus trituberculatus]|uniref:Uncharacterized protein n=1 Tax=Portunus trituberculatus TaxID=210409 RepID=A0A5B7GC87_PORTR|nr:hypothetical protein [Portunus trituberculatus]